MTTICCTRHTRLSRLACALALGLTGAQGWAYDLPQVNLGGTSFLDGGPPAGAGMYIAQYLQYYSGRLKDGNGKALALPKQEVDVLASLTQFLYVAPTKLSENLSWGINVNVPLVLNARVNDGLGGAALSAQNGVGDLQVGPFIQFDPVMGAAGPRFMHRFEFDVFAPTGDYDRTRSVNPGSNFWSVDPHWAATLWLTPDWTVSWRLHYLWNGRNNSPASTYGTARWTQAGQAVHANIATEYAVTPQLRLGINGYWLRQITDTKVDGVAQSGSREAVWAIGPGAVYSFSREDHVFANAYLEQGARNRSEGTRLWLRYVHHF